MTEGEGRRFSEPLVPSPCWPKAKPYEKAPRARGFFITRGADQLRPRTGVDGLFGVFGEDDSVGKRLVQKKGLT